MSTIANSKYFMEKNEFVLSPLEFIGEDCLKKAPYIHTYFCKYNAQVCTTL